MIEEICLPNELLDENDITEFLKNHSHHQYARTLRLNNYSLSEAHCQQVNQLLNSNTVFEAIYLRHAELTDEKIQILVPGLQQQSSLQILHLDNNLLTDEGLTFLLNSIKNIPLSEISLCFNQSLTENSGRILGKFIAQSSCLKTIHLNFCQLGNTGIKSFISYLPQAQTLQIINLQGTYITEEIIPLLTKVRESKPALSIDIRHNKIPKNKLEQVTYLLDNKISIPSSSTVVEKLDSPKTNQIPINDPSPLLEEKKKNIVSSNLKSGKQVGNSFSPSLQPFTLKGH